MNQPTNVLIVGAGRIGRAFAQLLTVGRHAQVGLWDKNPTMTPGTPPLTALAANADLVIFAIPTSAIRSAVAEVTPLLPPTATSIFLSKGLEADTKLCAAEIAEECIHPDRPWVVVGGPMVAEEIQAGARGQAVIAGPGVAIRRELESILPPEAMSFSESTRARDVSLSGVLKNVYALVYGLGVGLGWSPIALSDLWKRCEGELVLAADHCGIEREVILGPAGIEDFHATGGSPHSRNRNAGVQLATSGTFDHAAESIAAFPLLLERFPTIADLDCLHSLSAIFDHAAVSTSFEPLSLSTHQ